MKVIHKSYKFRLYPTKEQEVLLAKHFGSCRFIYNHYLNERKNAYLNNKQSINYYDNAKDLTNLKQNNDYSWLKEINSQSLQQSLRHLDSSYNNFFRKQNMFPKFKSKYNKQSFTVPQFISVDNNKLTIPKFKTGIKINIHREIQGEICFATISKTPTNKYFVSLTCEINYEPYIKTGKSVGIDTGIKTLATLSNGTIYSNINVLKQSIKKLKYKQKQLSKKNKGSKSREKQRLIVAKFHEKLANKRYDYLQKVTTDIVKNHDIICIEDLAVKNIMSNHNLALSMSDVGLGMFYQMLDYKSNWNDRVISKIDRFFPSSKTCSCCGWINQNLTLKDREWICPSCKTKHNRDHNASVNIETQGLNEISCGCGMQSQDKQKRVEALSVDKSMKLETI